MVAGGKIFTFDEVSKHNQSNDCWIIMNGKVKLFIYLFI